MPLTCSVPGDVPGATVPALMTSAMIVPSPRTVPSGPMVIPLAADRTPPFWTLSMAVPVSTRPIVNMLLAVHLEFGPSITTVPDEPDDRAIRPIVLETTPPPVIDSVPAPLLPTASTLLLVHTEPGPSTLAVLSEPLTAPILALKFETLPPSMTLSDPEPVWPT